jgi:hypothetical protein
MVKLFKYWSAIYMKKLIITLAAIILLTSCGAPETAEVIATPATTTASAFETVTTTTTGIVTATTPTEATTTEITANYAENIIEFPQEFLSENEDPQPPLYEIDADYYDGELTGNALKLYEDLNEFSIYYLENNGFEQFEKRNNIWLTGGQGHAFGLVDIYGNGKPVVFVYSSRGDQGYCQISFFDMYSDTPIKPLTEENAYGFCRDGLTYFGKNEHGETVMCSGYNHASNHGSIRFFKFKENTVNDGFDALCDGYFNAIFESRRANDLFCDIMNYDDNNSNDRIEDNDPTSELFYETYREFYDAIDFDVYWICGDILYHGAEETEYKGKMAYEKYIEFTRNQALLNDIYDHRKNYDKLLIDDINNDGIVEIVYAKPDLKIFTYYSNGQIKTLESLANVGGNCVCGSAPIYYNKKTDEIMIRRTYSDYRDICFYQYTDGDYNLIKQYQWGGFTGPLAIDEWYESPALDSLLQEENLTFDDLKKLDEDKLYEYAHMIGYVEKMDQYMFEDEIITEAEWENAINEFKSADGCISLCPYNTDLDFVDMQSEDFSDYVEKELFNN